MRSTRPIGSVRTPRLARARWVGLAATILLVCGGAARAGDDVLVAGPRTDGTGLTPDGRRLFVAGNLNDSLIILDTAGTASRSVAVGHLPYGVALSRDGARVFVSNWGARTVTVVDAASARVLDALVVGTHPSAII